MVENTGVPAGAAYQPQHVRGVFPDFVLSSPRRVAMPIAVYPALSLTGAGVRDVVTKAQAQLDTQVAMRRRYHTPIVLSAMDLSAEAQAFGAQVQMSGHEIPTVIGRLVKDGPGVTGLTVPRPGAQRTGVYLQAVRLLAALPDQPIVLGGMIGPFSLAGRLFGVSEALEQTAVDPDVVHALLEKAVAFLIEYAQAQKAAGAHGVLMAEPAAGLLSPRGLAEFSSAYVKRIVSAVNDERFTVILHNCGAKLMHLEAVLASGAKCLHFGAPMDLPAALAKVPSDVVVCGNLDPAAAFLKATPEITAARTRALLDATQGRRNFVISSGCDIPPGTAMANLDAFFEEVTKG